MKKQNKAEKRFSYQHLLKGNHILSDKRVIAGICIVITILIVIAINMVWQFLTHLGDMIRGNFKASMLFSFSKEYLQVYLLALVIAAFISLIITYQMYSSFRNFNYGQKGRARLLSHEETAERLTAIPEKDEQFPGWGSMPLSRYGDKLYIDQSLSNNLVVAITRSGKGEAFVIATIDIVSRAEKKASMIITDVKGELSKATIKHLIDRGYKVIIYDFFDFNFSHFYNPLEVITYHYERGNLDLADELCATLASVIYEDENAREKYWVEAPRAMFVAVTLGLIADCLKSGQREKITMYSIYVFISTLGKSKDEKKIKSDLDKYFNSRPEYDPARLAYSSIDFSKGNTRASVMSLTINKLDIFRRPSVSKITSKNTFDMTELGFGDKPVAIFFREPYYTRTYDALVTIYINQAFYMNMHKASIETNGKLPRRVRVVGDEIFNFPPLPRMDNMMTVCLGANWSFDLYAQSYAQVEKVLGKDTAQIVIDNCGTSCFLSSPSESTRKKFSELLGNVTTTNVTRSGSRLSLNKSITEAQEERALITPQELTELTISEVIVFPTMCRVDLKGNPVTPRPIFNTGSTAMTYRNIYLPEFDPDDSIPYDRLEVPVGGLSNVDLKKLLYLPNGTKTASAESLRSDTVGNTISPTKIQYLQGILGNDFYFQDMTIEEFEKTIDALYAGGEIKDRAYINAKNTIKGGV